MSVSLGPIDRLLNGMTMYRLVLWWLVVLVGAAAVFSALGILPFNAGYILASALFLVAVSVLANEVFARVFAWRRTPSRSLSPRSSWRS